MTQSDNDKTVISVESGGMNPPAGGERRKARLICLDTSLVEGTPKELVIPLVDGQQTVGRSEECTFPIPSRRLSRQHARVFSGPGGWCVEDLNSTNGVHVDGAKIASAVLTHGQEVRFGPVPFRFEIESVSPVVDASPVEAEDEERTMMVGSAGASRAVLEAARTVDPAIEAPPVKAVPRPSARGREVPKPEAAPKGKSRLPLILIVCVLLGGAGGAGWVLYPRWERQKAMEELLRSEEKLSRDLIAINQNSLAPKARDSKDDEEKREAEIKAKRLALDEFRRDAVSKLSADLGYAPLAKAIAPVEFLLFEPKFSDALKRGDFAGAVDLVNGLSAREAELERMVSSAADAGVSDALRAERDLARLASLVVDYRRFAAAHPQVTKDPAARPNPGEVAALVKSQADFAALTRGSALTMQINYHLFFRVVDDADKMDIILINHWKDALTGG